MAIALRPNTKRALIMRVLISLVLLGLVAIGSKTTLGLISVKPPQDGHSANLTFKATGFFHTAFDGKRWWLVTPDGHPFYMSSVDHVDPAPDVDKISGQCPYCIAIASKYPNDQAWASATVARLRSWGFNSLGSWSNTSLLGSQMPYTVLLSMASGSDWFSSGFVTNANQVAQSQVAPLKNNPNIIGYYTDSELRFGPDWTDQHTILDNYLNLPVGSPGRVIAQSYIHDPNGFLKVLAIRYFSVTSEAIKSVDPNHLILGVKMLAQLTSPVVLEAAAPYVDAFSIDDYALVNGLPNYIKSSWNPYLSVDGNLTQFYRYVKKPIIIGEYSFRGGGGLAPNTWPPIYPTFSNQSTRTAAYVSFIKGIYSSPWVIGDQWFEYVDEPAGGRFDGENSNFGLVSSADVPWQTLVNTMTQMHGVSPNVLVGNPSPCWSWIEVGSGTQLSCLVKANTCPRITTTNSSNSLWPWCSVPTKS